MNKQFSGAEAQSPVQLSGARVLLVDDAKECQRFGAWALTKAGAIVDVADNGVVALEMTAAAARGGAAYDLILTDIEMPRMDGRQLLAALGHAQIGTPIVALTAHGADRDPFFAAGFCEVIAKPFTPAQLLSVCGRFLATQSP